MAYSATKPAKSALFKEYLNYYMARVGLSQNRLAVCARINQSRFNKIYNGTIKNVSVDTLICICLALGLNENETHDLLACQERAFSPAEPAHQAYLELIRIYSEKEIIYDTTPQNLSTILEYADVYLRERKFAELPNANLSAKIDGKQLMDKPDGFVEVEFSGLELGAYETKEGVRFTAKATGIALVNRKA